MRKATPATEPTSSGTPAEAPDEPIKPPSPANSDLPASALHSLVLPVVGLAVLWAGVLSFSSGLVTWDAAPMAIVSPVVEQLRWVVHNHHHHHHQQQQQQQRPTAMPPEDGPYNMLHLPPPRPEHTAHYQELCIHSYYAGEMDVGRRACESLVQLLAMRNEDGNRAKLNRRFYSRLLHELIPASYVHLTDSTNVGHPGWYFNNPSIIPYGDGYLLLVRNNNHRWVDGSFIVNPGEGGVFRSKVVVFHMSDALVLEEAVMAKLPEYEKTNYPVDGLEDSRVNLVGGKLVVTSNVRNYAPYNGNNRVAVMELDLENYALVNLTVPPSPSSGHEKNWMPFFREEEWLYSSWHRGAVVTVAFNEDRKSWGLNVTGPSHPIAQGFKGSSSLVPLPDGGWLGIVHETAVEDTGAQSVYEHRFIRLDARKRLVAVSQLFTFRERGVPEFCAGLARRGSDLVATFGVVEVNAWAVKLSLDDVLRRMVPL